MRGFDGGFLSVPSSSRGLGAGWKRNANAEVTFLGIVQRRDNSEKHKLIIAKHLPAFNIDTGQLDRFGVARARMGQPQR